jgi:hypothetical protein
MLDLPTAGNDVRGTAVQPYLHGGGNAVHHSRAAVPGWPGMHDSGPVHSELDIFSLQMQVIVSIPYAGKFTVPPHPPFHVKLYHWFQILGL